MDWLTTATITRFVLDSVLQNLIINTSTQLTNAVGHEGASPIIRVPWPEEWMIKRALDAGAHGVMTPMCHSAVCVTSPIIRNCT